MEAEMYIVRVTANQNAFLCGNCGAYTLESGNYCPSCGSKIVSYADDGDDLTDAYQRYLHDTGFNEGYKARCAEDEE